MRSSFDQAVPAAMYSISCFFLHGDLWRAGMTAVAPWIERAGFEVLHELPFVPSGRLGTRLCSAGKDVVRPEKYDRLVIAVDLSPWATNKHVGGTHLPVDNQRLSRVTPIERWIRARWSQAPGACSAPEPAPSEPLIAHLATGQQVDDALREISHALYRDVHDQAQAGAASLIPPLPVIEEVSNWAAHGRSYIVEHQGQPAFCKVFRPKAGAYLANEVEVMERSRDLGFVPRLLDHGDNWFVSTLVRGVLARELCQDSQLLPLSTARRIFEAARALHELGYVHLELNPSNVIVSRGSITLIDFENIYRIDPACPFAESPLFLGEEHFHRARVRLWPEVDLPPLFQKWHYHTYARTWHPVVGVGVDHLLSDPTWKLTLMRARNRASRWRRQKLADWLNRLPRA